MSYPVACSECDLLLPSLPKEFRTKAGTPFLLWECFDPDCGSFVIQFPGEFLDADVIEIRELFGECEVEAIREA